MAKSSISKDAVNSANYVNEFFSYKKDKNDEHKILSPKNPYGDCEDYSLTVAFYLANKSISTLIINFILGIYQLRRCYDPYNQPHYVLMYKNYYIDNQLKKWVSKKELNELGYSRFKYIAGWVTVSKLLIS